MPHFNSQLLFALKEWLFQHSKFLLLDFFFFFLSILDFCLTFQHTFSLSQIERCLCQEISFKGTQDTSQHKKRCGGGGEKTSETLQKYLFVLCFTALKLFSSFELLKSVTCWQLFTWNVSFVWFETAEIIIPKWQGYNTERNISMHCISCTSILMTSVD